MKRPFLVFMLIVTAMSCRQSNDEKSRSILAGKWGSGCLPIAGALPSIKVQYHFFDGASVERSQQYYRDAECKELAGEFIHRGDFALEVRSEINVFNIDMFLNRVRASALTAEGASLWNTLKLCDIEDWAIDQERDVLGNTDPSCLSFGTTRIEYRDLVEVEGERSIIFGQTLGHLTPRPDKIKASEADVSFSFLSN